MKNLCYFFYDTNLFLALLKTPTMYIFVDEIDQQLLVIIFYRFTKALLLIEIVTKVSVWTVETHLKYQDTYKIFHFPYNDSVSFCCRNNWELNLIVGKLSCSEGLKFPFLQQRVINNILYSNIVFIIFGLLRFSWFVI